MATATRSAKLIRQVLRLRCGDRYHDFVYSKFEQACIDDDLDTISTFVEEGLVPLYCVTSHDRIPLQVTATWGGPQAVELLLQMGADPNGQPTMTQFCYPPIRSAVRRKDTQMTEILLHYDANLERLLPVSAL